MSSKSVKITLPDGSLKSYIGPITAIDVAREISEVLARNVLAARVNDQVVDATRIIDADATL